MQDGIDAEIAAVFDDSFEEALLFNPDSLEVTQYAPPTALAPFVTQMYFFRCSQVAIRDFQPAALGHLVFYLQGSGELRFHDGHVDPIPPVSIFGPCGAAAEFNLKGPFANFGIVLSPLGFVALTGKPANQYADRLVDASKLFGPEIVSLAQSYHDEAQSGQINHATMIQRVTQFLVKNIHPVSAAHISLISIVTTWLSSEFDPDVEALYAKLPMSRSTATRLIARYFGASPKAVMRKYRAVRAATHLCDPDCPAEMKERIASLFFDQSHMIREIRHFTGRTPGALGSDANKILRMWLSKDNYRNLDVEPG